MPVLSHSELSEQEIFELVRGVHPDPFACLGLHSSAGGKVVRSLLPRALAVSVIDGSGYSCQMSKIHEAGLFELRDKDLPDGYRLAVETEQGVSTIDDPYSFAPVLGEVDHFLLGEGTHEQLFQRLGSHVTDIEGVSGVQFGVWAPNASTCSLIGDFNHWDERSHAMRKHHTSGLWEIFIPGIQAGVKYKYALHDRHGIRLPDKNDPYARYFEPPPGNASIVYESGYSWRDQSWQQAKRNELALDKPVAIYEVHLASWRHTMPSESHGYRELAEHLIPYVRDNGYTHLELMPATEHPFAGSWGYQPIGLFAPSHRLGTPDDFRYFVDQCHQAGIGVIMDWVPAHFPADDHGLGHFDGTHLYEHADPKQGRHKDWDTLIYNFGRHEVCNYLLCNALFWLREFHLDGLRVDAVASMLYLDYSRGDGEWVPNQHGGNHNLEAVHFLQRMNQLVHREGCITMAEESTSWQGVSHPVEYNGLGFTYKWNMGWMNDMLEYISTDPVHRKHCHNKLTFGLTYAFSENFVLPISHDEVVYGKGSLIEKMPGDSWQSFANLRCFLAFMYGYPGKKLLFMGSEFAQKQEWSHDRQLDWDLLASEPHAQVLQLTKQLNQFYRDEPAMHRGDCDELGFQWIDCDDSEQSIVSFYRRVPRSPEAVIFVCNFTPVVRQAYRLGVHDVGCYREILNTDELSFGGSGVINSGPLTTEDSPAHNLPQSLEITLPPLAVIVLKQNP